MGAPLAGYLYFDENLHGGHYFVVGPDDPWDADNVLVFCCTSQPHHRPPEAGCFEDLRYHSFHLPAGTVSRLTKPTWVLMGECYPYKKADFSGRWRVPREKLSLSLTVELLLCASRSKTLALTDSQRCAEEATAIQQAMT